MADEDSKNEEQPTKSNKNLYFSLEEEAKLETLFTSQTINQYLGIIITKLLADSNKDEVFKNERWEYFMTIAEKSYNRFIKTVQKDESYTSINFANATYITLSLFLEHIQ